MAKLVFGMNMSLDGYVDYDRFAPDPALFRYFIEQTRNAAGSIYGPRLCELMSYWDGDGARGAASIKIDVVREMLSKISYRPFEGRRRVVLIREADTLEPEMGDPGGGSDFAAPGGWASATACGDRPGGRRGRCPPQHPAPPAPAPSCPTRSTSRRSCAPCRGPTGR